MSSTPLCFTQTNTFYSYQIRERMRVATCSFETLELSKRIVNRRNLFDSLLSYSIKLRINNSSVQYYYASPSSGEAYRDRQLTTYFEL